MGTHRTWHHAIARLFPQRQRHAPQGSGESAPCGEYRHNEEAGIYVDVVSGEPLFASIRKYDGQIPVEDAPRFVPVDDLEVEGYGAYRRLFDKWRPGGTTP